MGIISISKASTAEDSLNPCSLHQAANADCIHVIEHSALLAEQKKCEQWKALAMGMREALEGIHNEQCAGDVCSQMWYQDVAEEAITKFDQRVEELG